VPHPFSRLQRHNEESGFTLVELTVVVLVIAILITMVSSTFFEVRNLAHNQSAKDLARNGLTAEKTYYSDRAGYTDLGAALTAIEPALSFVTLEGSMSGGATVYVKKYTVGAIDDTVVVGARSRTGTCFWLRDSSANPPGTQYLVNSTCVAPDHTTAMYARW
jgi:prepilin-type N-terminal cleavage/methylation domain-containing protein